MGINHGGKRRPGRPLGTIGIPKNRRVVTTSFCATPKIMRALRARARREGVSVSAVVGAAVKAHLANATGGEHRIGFIRETSQGASCQ